MLNACNTFRKTIEEARHLTSLFDFLSEQIRIPYSLDDLLRAQVVYAVAAFDKLMHDLIRIGMRQTFIGTRAPTAKYLAEPITLEIHAALTAATIPPREYLFDLEVARKLGRLSFQRPDAVAEGLSLIWAEPQKWSKIAAAMEWDPQDARTKLTLIATRRNTIVHESDFDPVTGIKRLLTRAECEDITNFLELCGRAIVTLVSQPIVA